MSDSNQHSVQDARDLLDEELRCIEPISVAIGESCGECPPCLARQALRSLEEQLETAQGRANEMTNQRNTWHEKALRLEEQYGTLRKAAEDLYLSVVGPARIIGPFEYVRPDALIALRDALQASTPASSQHPSPRCWCDECVNRTPEFWEAQSPAMSPRSDRPSSGSLDGHD